MSLSSYILKEASNGVTAFGTPVFYVLCLLVLAHYDRPFALHLAVVLATVELAGAAIKLLFPTERPIARPRTTVFERIDAGSFPSIHSARTAALACSLMLQGYDAQLFWIAVALALAVGWSRIQLKHHRLIDVCGGYALGMLISFLLLRSW